MKSTIPKTLSLFWIHIFMVLVIFQHAESRCAGPILPHTLPTYCCKDLEEAVTKFCGKDNYEIDYDSDAARDCCYKGCTGYGLAMFCKTHVDVPPYPRFCCADFEIAVAQVCGVDNYIIDSYSTKVRDCCNYGCSELGLQYFCITPTYWPDPLLPIYCCDGIDEAVDEECGEGNYDPLNPYDILEQQCCINGCGKTELQQFCLGTSDTSDTTSTSDTSTDTSAQTTNTPTAETTDPSAVQTTNPTLMETTDPNPTSP